MQPRRCERCGTKKRLLKPRDGLPTVCFVCWKAKGVAMHVVPLSPAERPEPRSQVKQPCQRRCARCGERTETRYFDAICLCERCARSRWPDGREAPESAGMFAWSTNYPKRYRGRSAALPWSRPSQ